MNTESTKTCPKCAAPIPPEAPQGLCPKCVLAAVAPATEAGQPPEPPPVLPTLESIAAGFPQLEILEFIGQGGMGLVFKARQRKLDRFVALKLLPQKPGSDPAFCERFTREARVLARLSHPNIVAVHDFGEAGPFFYLLMEFVDGVNLRQAMRAGTFTPAQALALVPKICDALQYAHEEGVLHRDIKPENLLLDSRGRIKIADFGIAKMLGETKDITLTAKGFAVGTPHYMAPEQFEHPQEVDQRADVYSLGVVFYEMLTGELPIGRFPPPSEKATIDPRVDQVVLRALEKERERRYQSAGDVKTQIENITATPGAALRSSGQPGAGENQASGWPKMGGPAGIGLVGLSLLVLVLLLMDGGHIGQPGFAQLSLAIGLSAMAGTVLSWTTLRRFKAAMPQSSDSKWVLLSAVAWPLLLANLALLIPTLFFARSLHLQESGILVLAAAVAVLATLAGDIYLVKAWLARWNSERRLPYSFLRDLLKKVPWPLAWLAGAGLATLILLFLLMPRRGPVDLPQVYTEDVPNAPAGFEVPPGAPPGNEQRIYRSGFTVPAGYALSLRPVLCSNLTTVADQLNAGAVVVAPEGAPLQAELKWRLLGNTSLADGAPMEMSVDLLQGPDPIEKVFYVIPPEPVSVNWVGEPPQLWPPQSGRTRFLLAKGLSSDPLAQNLTAAEWGVGVELRLDPIPESLKAKLKSPMIETRTNWLGELGMRVASSNGVALAQLESVSTVTLDQQAQYVETCTLIQRLSARERGLLLTFTPQSSFVKETHQALSNALRLKAELEAEHPELAAKAISPGAVPSSDAPGQP